MWDITGQSRAFTSPEEFKKMSKNQTAGNAGNTNADDITARIADAITDIVDGDTDTVRAIADRATSAVASQLEADDAGADALAEAVARQRATACKSRNATSGATWYYDPNTVGRINITKPTARVLEDFGCDLRYINSKGKSAIRTSLSRNATPELYDATEVVLLELTRRGLIVKLDKSNATDVAE